MEINIELFTVCFTVYTESDKNLHTEVKTFGNWNDARALFNQYCWQAHLEALFGENWDEENKNDSYRYDMEEKQDKDEYTAHSDAYEGFHVNVKFC